MRPFKYAALRRSPAMISSENGLLLATVLLNVQGRDVGGFVEEARVGSGHMFWGLVTARDIKVNGAPARFKQGGSSAMMGMSGPMAITVALPPPFFA